MKTKNIFYLLSLSLSVIFTCPAQQLIPGNKIRPLVNPTVEKKYDSFLYSYVIMNQLGAEQAIWVFQLHLAPNIALLTLGNPNLWKGSHLNEGGDLRLNWNTPTDQDIKPNQSLSGYFISAVSLPGIVPFYTEGWVQQPDSVGGSAEDSIPGYTGLTPYGPGVVGKTIGPGPIPEPFIHSVFLDTLVSYVQQVYDLRWLGDSHLLSRVNRDLTQAKRTLSRGDSVRCGAELASFQKVLQEEHSATVQQKGKHIPYVSDEAYYLLYYNAQYLIDHLPQSAK